MIPLLYSIIIRTLKFPLTFNIYAHCLVTWILIVKQTWFNKGCFSNACPISLFSKKGIASAKKIFTNNQSTYEGEYVCFLQPATSQLKLCLCTDKKLMRRAMWTRVYFSSFFLLASLFMQPKPQHHKPSMIFNTKQGQIATKLVQNYLAKYVAISRMIAHFGRIF